MSRSIDEEIIRYHEDRLERLSVVATTRPPSGQILGWVPIESQDPHGTIATPPPARARSKVANATSMAATFEMQNPGIERGPEGTVPLLRRRVPLTKNLRDASHKRKVDGRRLLPESGSSVPDGPSPPAGWYHGTMSQSATGYGCEAVLAVWDPWCELTDDHSISQFGLQNYDNPQLQSLEA